jgi:hypothetical protein
MAEELKALYFKLSPSTSRYHRLMQLASIRNCAWQDVIRNAVDFYLEHAQPEILTPSKPEARRNGKTS